MPGPVNHVEGAVEIHPTATVESSTIVGPAIIGPGALVLDSYIGPYTSIGADVHIEGAEVERSIILPGARITHIGGRLVGSVVGRDARRFRDFSLPSRPAPERRRRRRGGAVLRATLRRTATPLRRRSCATARARRRRATAARLRVAMVHLSDFRLDSRIQRQARALAERGDEVDLVCVGEREELRVGEG